MNTDLKKRFSIPDRNCRRKKRKREPLPLGREKKKAWEEDGAIKSSTARLGFGDLFPISDSKDEKPI